MKSKTKIGIWNVRTLRETGKLRQRVACMKERAGVKLSSWPEIGSDGDVLLTPYLPKGITGYDDDDIVDYTVKCEVHNTEYAGNCLLWSV